MTPALQIEQRPDEQPAILLASQVLVDEPEHGSAVEELEDARLPVVKRAPDVLDALAFGRHVSEGLTTRERNRPGLSK